jgi:hypothetical protein
MDLVGDLSSDSIAELETVFSSSTWVSLDDVFELGTHVSHMMYNVAMNRTYGIVRS